MTKFEEEVKRPDNTGIEPFSKRDVDFSKLAAKFARAAQTLKKWREYAGYLGDKLDTANHNLYLETEQSSAYHAEIVELKRENQRLVAENLAVKTLVDNAKPQQALPVVPEYVGSWIECVKGKNNNALALLDDDNMPDDVNEWLFFQRNDNNINLILRAWLDGYTVEKPQLFYLKHIDMSKTNEYYDYYLSKTPNGSLGHSGIGKGKLPKLKCILKLTKAEIDSMKTGSYEQIPVEDGE
ncbi:DUF1642 domain-containing protein [Lactococcus lactis]|uniref:DUF1642 domain-containing protein n=1 Tax=Lactococcus lactis TaxID=1358 RepID=UPI0032E4B69A